MRVRRLCRKKIEVGEHMGSRFFKLQKKRVNRCFSDKSASLRDRALGRGSAGNPVCVFHHIPKCGGTSVLDLLDNWFLNVLDYRKGWSMDYPPKTDLATLSSRHCLCGHFELSGFFLYQRYPEIFLRERFLVFTFVRDPLPIQLSLFRYEQKNNVSKYTSVEDHLLNRESNYLANRFPVNEANYKEVLSKYFFIGVLEQMQKSIDVLADKLGKKNRGIQRLNETCKGKVAVSDDILQEFMKNNELDYKIYDYCLKRFGEDCGDNGFEFGRRQRPW